MSIILSHNTQGSTGQSHEHECNHTLTDGSVRITPAEGLLKNSHQFYWRVLSFLILNAVLQQRDVISNLSDSADSLCTPVSGTLMTQTKEGEEF